MKKRLILCLLSSFVFSYSQAMAQYDCSKQTLQENGQKAQRALANYSQTIHSEAQAEQQLTEFGNRLRHAIHCERQAIRAKP